MSMQQFCLRWNNHQPNFISVFSSLLTNETLVDVTLGAEGRHLQAHKVVLSACSTYFQSLFTVNPCQHPIVILKDVKFSELKIMVDFMYYGEVNVSQEQLPSIIKTAESLKIKGLAEMHTASITKWPSGTSEHIIGDCGESCSPGPSPVSPSFRRKRSRKSSTGSASGEKSDEVNEVSLVATDTIKPEPVITIHSNLETIKRPVNASTESQGSIDEDQKSIISNMESGSTATPSQSDGGGSMQNTNQQSTGTNNGQSSHSSQSTSHQAAYHGKQVEAKRGRLLLMRQPRVKKETEPGHPSPDSEPGSPRIVSSSSLQPATPTLNLPSTSQHWQENDPASTSKQTLLTVTTCTNLLTVPQPTYLVKQHSHPLLPSQQQGSSSGYWMQRQHSNPEYPGRSTSPVDAIPLIKIEEGQTESGRLIKDSGGNSSVSGLRIIPAELLRSSSTPQLGSSVTESRNFREGGSDQRLGHCPVQRPGPALGCNHCWNTVDTHGRTLRRKTKYHCPECQINLCIVPCFQEFHERQRESSITVKTLPKTSSI
ncbi:hypothetical protein PV327_007633 [Microctonus hyperodae]|uniref:BTB domain-containing protein n=1 Tax=Microctonus hyperodae TaxID=165561 RepID=A0AA39KYN9_MICHY|nr:hypothetical protein PV327_007633 [Microctonus hyperodae]